MGSLSLPRKISILGSTGSVGVSTLDVLAQAGVDVEVTALAAGRNVEKLAEQALLWRPRIAVIGDEAGLPQLRAMLQGSGIEAAAGVQATVDAASEDSQWVM
jgi:1-deoxy-D-xylulose-5-phosphate reductoisomerase